MPAKRDVPPRSLSSLPRALPGLFPKHFPTRWLGACWLAAVLAGCASGSAPGQSMVRYDFGLSNLAASAGPQAVAPAFPPGAAIKVLDVGAPAGLDSDEFHYRLQYADGQQTHVYASSRWTMTPAQLLTQRLRTRLAARGAVVAGGDLVQAPVLKLDLDNFEQVFDAPGASRGIVAVRATLLKDGALLAQQSFSASRASPSADAPGGARALAAASDAVIDQIVAWLARQPSP
jgi:cholesterol transport system auxiliary component